MLQDAQDEGKEEKAQEQAMQLEPTSYNEGSEYTQFLMVIIIIVTRLEHRHNMLPIPAGGSLYPLIYA